MGGKDAVRATLDHHHFCERDGVGGCPGLFVRGGPISSAVDDRMNRAGVSRPCGVTQDLLGGPGVGELEPIDQLAASN
jgi:hypothetical protein